MKSTSKMICISDENLIGAGAHKITYMHPNDNSLCLKIAKNPCDIDIIKELTYRSVLEKKHKQAKLLPLYYGTIETNKGLAHVFERIHNYDNQTSLTLDKYIERKISTVSFQKAQEELMQLLLDFKKLWFEEKPVTSNIELVNFMVQQLSKNEQCIRIVDNIGTPAHIPLAYYVEYFASKRAQRYWKRFLNVLETTYPDFFSQNFINKLAE